MKQVFQAIIIFITEVFLFWYAGNDLTARSSENATVLMFFIAIAMTPIVVEWWS